LKLDDGGTRPSAVGPAGGSGGEVMAAYVRRWISNYVILYSYSTIVHNT
jgi:hypothetical protein